MTKRIWIALAVLTHGVNVAFAEPIILDCETDDGLDWGTIAIDLERRIVEKGESEFAITFLEDDVIVGIAGLNWLPTTLILHRFAGRFVEFGSSRVCLPDPAEDCENPSVITWEARGPCNRQQF